VIIAGGFANVVLGDALPRPQARAHAFSKWSGFRSRRLGMAPAVQKEVDRRFSICASPRASHSRVCGPGRGSAGRDVAAFTRWRTSRFGIQRAGYQALSQLMQAAWYGNNASWASIGYSGPPQLS
jgi:hypothetical protein